jgi:hypothetical protein
MAKSNREPWPIERVARVYKPNEPMKYSSPYGHVITEDGTVYALNYQYYHGIACAILFPELAKECGYPPPSERHSNVYEYQRFELDNHRILKVIRICGFRFASEYPSVNSSVYGATDKQIEAFRKVCKTEGWNMRTVFNTDHGDLKMTKTITELQTDRSAEWDAEHLKPKMREKTGWELPDDGEDDAD